MIIPATFTFTDIDGNIDESSMRKYIQFLIQKGVKALYVNGSTAEAFLLSTEDRMKALDIIRDETPQELLLIVQIGSISTKESVRLAKHAEKVGANILSAVTPFYYKFSWQEIHEHYMYILKQVTLPFCPYYIPQLSGVNVDREQLVNILQHPQVTHLKYSSNDFYTMQKVKVENPDIMIFNGYDEMLLSGLVAGADGAIGSTYNFTFAMANTIVQSLEQGNIAQAKKSQNTINTFVDVMLDVGLWQGMKYLFSKIGIGNSKPTRPFLPILEHNKQKIDRLIEEYPHLLE